MVGLLARLRSDLNAARKEGRKAQTLLLGTVIADVMNRAIELKRDPTDDEVVDVLRRGVKKRREAVEAYQKAAREDLAGNERAEVAMLEQYLPAQATDDEIRTAVREAIAGGASNIGAVMGRAGPPLKGRADGARISAIAREELAARG